MAELKFVLKSLLITAAIMFVLQFEVQKGVRMEAYLTDYLRSGTVSLWVRESMKGAHQFVMNSSTELAPKMSLKHWAAKLESKPEAPRNVSSDIPAEFPDDEISEGAAQEAGAF